MSTLDVAKTGLIAFSKAQQMTSHNISNVNTKGFIKSKASFTELPSVGTPPIGTGVQFRSVLVDSMLDMINSQIFEQTGDVGYEQGIKDGLEGIPENGVPSLLKDLQNFNNSAEELANNPDDLVVKQAFLDASNQLTSGINNLTETIDNHTETINRGIANNVDAINSLSISIARSMAGGVTPAGEIEELGTMIGIDVVDGTIITNDGAVLVQDGRAGEISAGDITPNSGGYVGGLKSITTEVIPKINGLLEDAMTKFVNSINDVMPTGTTLFNQSGNKYNVVPTSADEIVAGVGPGDNSIALAIVNQIDGEKFKTELLQTDYVLHSKKRNNASSVEREEFFLTQLEGNRDDKYGVDLDVEAVNMIKYQRAYEAMAKVIQADNAMFRALINITA